MKSISYLFVGLLLFVFSYSLFSKLLNFNQFSLDLLASPLINYRFVNGMKYLVPGIELLIIAMIISRYKEAGYYLAFFSLIVFTTYYILFYKVAQSNCGCGKMFDNLGFYPHLSLNIFLLIGSVYLIYYPIQVYPLKNSK
jgi:hypothetical protein